MALQTAIGGHPQISARGLDGVSRIFERGATQLPARTSGAVCQSFPQNITDLQHRQEVKHERFWRRASEQQVLDAVISGVLDASMLYRFAAMTAVERGFDRVVAAMDERGLLAPAGAAAAQGLFDRAVKGRGAAAARVVRCLLTRYPAINPAANNNAAVAACGSLGNAAMLEVLLADAR